MNEPRINILMIEDDEEDVHLMSLSLSEVWNPTLRFQLQWAPTLQEGISNLGKEDFDVILLDLMLPDSQGLDTISRLHQHSGDTPIVILSNMNDEEIAVEALGLGAQDYLVKGRLDPMVLKRAVRYAIERSLLQSGVKAVLDNAGDAILVVTDGVVRYANPACAAVFGRNPHEWLGKPFGYAIAARKTSEIKIPNAKGEERSAEMRVTELEWKRAPALLVTVRDITDLKRTQELKAEIKERRRLDALKDQFMSAVSHELRSPLTVVQAAIDNLFEGRAGALSQSQSVMVSLAHRNLHRLSRLINNILDISRLESGMAEVRLAPVDVARLVVDSVQGFALEGEKHGIAVRAKLGADTPHGSADEDLLAQVINNLLDNALRFARSEVVVSAAKGLGNEVKVVVEDDGPGIPQEKIESLFNRFVQINRPAGGSGYKGTGLGLAICKEIVDRHKGKIWVESKAGHGARFSVSLPAAQAPVGAPKTGTPRS